MYLNGQLTAEQEAKISIYEHGYLYGVGLFETFRTYEGKPFLLEQHLQRLQQACNEIGLLWEPDLCKLKQQITELLQVNKLQDGYFRYNVAAGAYPLGLPQGRYTNVTEALLIKELPPPSKEKHLITLSINRNTPEGSMRFKSHHYLNNILAKKETPLGAEGVFLTKEGHIAEGIVSNLFFVTKGTLYTPAVDTGILNGITRQFVLQLAQELGVPFEEGYYTLQEAYKAEEVFVTNSIQEIVPVGCWDDIKFVPLGPESLTHKLVRNYQNNTRIM